MEMTPDVDVMDADVHVFQVCFMREWECGS
jgi:hypothetical protein